MKHYILFLNNDKKPFLSFIKKTDKQAMKHSEKICGQLCLAPLCFQLLQTAKNGKLLSENKPIGEGWLATSSDKLH